MLEHDRTPYIRRPAPSFPVARPGTSLPGRNVCKQHSKQSRRGKGGMTGLIRTQLSKAGCEPANRLPLVPATLPAAEIQAIKDHVDRTGASATLHKQDHHWAGFSRRCADRGQQNLQARPEVVASFFAPEAKRRLKPPTLTRVLAAVNYFHGTAGFLRPRQTSRDALVLKVLGGARRWRKIPLMPEQATTADVILIVMSCIGQDGDRLADLRNRQLLSFGITSAMRRSKLVILAIAHLQFSKRSVLGDEPAPRTHKAGVESERLEDTRGRPAEVSAGPGRLRLAQEPPQQPCRRRLLIAREPPS
jgi:hypothetical protein